MRAIFLALPLVVASPQPAQAHPHIFIDAGLEIVFDSQGRAEGVKVRWTYDELISLTFITERGLDPDFDSVLTDAEKAQLNGFDMDWQADFAGDTYVLLGDTPINLASPEAWTADYVAGKVISTHYRRFEMPVDLGGAALVVQAYDPGYYTAYAVVEAGVTGREGCLAEMFEPDRDAADQILQDALAEYSGTDGIEAEYPAVGSAYAEEARVTCSAP